MKIKEFAATVEAVTKTHVTAKADNDKEYTFTRENRDTRKNPPENLKIGDRVLVIWTPQAHYSLPYIYCKLTTLPQSSAKN